MMVRSDTHEYFKPESGACGSASLGGWVKMKVCARICGSKAYY